MEPMKYKITWKTLLLPLIGILGFLLYILLFNVDILLIIRNIETTNLTVYLIAASFIFLETLFYSISWRTLLRYLSVKLSIQDTYLYVWYGFFMDIIIPAESISGEVTRLYLVTRDTDDTSGKVVASLVMHRLLGMSINTVSLFVGAYLLLGGGQVGGLLMDLTLVLILITTVVLILLMLLCVKENWTLGVIDFVIKLASRISRGRLKLTKIREEAVRSAQSFHCSMKEFVRSPATVSVSLLYYVISWVFSLSVSYLVFLSLGYPISWSAIIITWSIVIAVKSIPVGVPFEVGLPEITMTTLYILLGIAPGVAATATVLNRLLTLWLRFFVGFGSQQLVEFRAMRKKKVSDQAPAPQVNS